MTLLQDERAEATEDPSKVPRPKPYTPNPEAETLNPKDETLNPKP